MFILFILATLICTHLAAEMTQKNGAPDVVQKPSITLECFSTVMPKYHTLTYGNPYMVKIKNVSSSRVIVHPSVIRDIMLKEPIIEILRTKMLLGTGVSLGITALSAVLTRFVFNVATTAEQIDAQLVARYPSIQVYDNTAAWAKFGLGVTFCGAAVTALCYWSYWNIDSEIDEHILHTPITLEPGQEVCKYFWLKAPTTEIVFDTDAIEVI